MRRLLKIRDRDVIGVARRGHTLLHSLSLIVALACFPGCSRHGSVSQDSATSAKQLLTAPNNTASSSVATLTSANSIKEQSQKEPDKKVRICSNTELASLAALLEAMKSNAASSQGRVTEKQILNIVGSAKAQELTPHIYGFSRAEYQCWLQSILRSTEAVKDNARRNSIRCVDGTETMSPSQQNAAPETRSALVSAYFTPIFSGSTHKTTQFSAPMRAVPSQLVRFDPSQFGLAAPVQPLRGIVRNGTLEPYPGRAVIEQDSIPEHEVLAWLDPIDLFHAQTQGSAVIRYTGGELVSFEFAEKNGRPYVALATELPIQAPVTWQKIEEYLRDLPEAELRETLARNPSYIFFRRSEVTARTASGDPALPNITIAVDPTALPFGALGALTVDDGTHTVLSHDIGGAIKGNRRIDWYLGVGEDAGDRAGTFRQSGRLVFFVPAQKHQMVGSTCE